MVPEAMHRLGILVCIVLVAGGCSRLKDNPHRVQVHPAGWLDPSSAQFHGQAARTAYRDGRTSFCQSCHGRDYRGGESGVDCVDCHISRGSVQCTACHGSRDNQTGAPPADLLGDTAAAARGVGAHTTMVEGFALCAGFDCGACHAEPAFVLSPGHFEPADLGGDSARAEVVFGALADPGDAAYDPLTGTCARVYCHGNFTGGTVREVTFRDRYAAAGDTAGYLQFSQAACGSCHPFSGTAASWDYAHGEHTEDANLDCGGCHLGVAQGLPTPRIMDRTLHVNGARDVLFGPAAGAAASWNSDAQSCADIACHGGGVRLWTRHEP